MSGWVRVDTRFTTHPKVLDIGPLGEALWLRGLCYAGEHLTDGFIPAAFVRRMNDIDGEDIADRLLDAGLWTQADGGYQIHEYLSWQRSRDEAADISIKRSESGRKGGLQKASNHLANAKQTSSKLPASPASKRLADTDTDTDTEIIPPLPPPRPTPRKERLYRDMGFDGEQQFARFWEQYPRKVSKQVAARVWLRMSPDEWSAALEALPCHKQSSQWTKDDGQFVPHPASWLNGRRWEDEVPAPSASNGHAPSRRLTDEEVARGLGDTF